MVALLSITGQVLVQVALQTQSSDSRVVNLAGRQRMLSQRLSKASLALLSVAPEARPHYAKELALVVELWERTHRGLQWGDAKEGLPGASSAEVSRMFAAIEADHQAMLASARALLGNSDLAASAVAEVLAHERSFVEGMDRIVFQYDKEAKARVTRLKIIEISLLTLTLTILTLEGFFVFRPAVRRVVDSVEQIRLSKEEIEKKNEALAKSEMAISETNARIIDSLLYAERIQRVILPSKGSLARVFPECFVLFHPKDIVSGDFYWFYDGFGTSILAVGDCTGHGVPGALMAMFGSALLTQIVVEKHVLEPARILEELHLGIRRALKQEELDATIEGAQDGMDVGILRVDSPRDKVWFAGAHRPLVYMDDMGILGEIRGDRRGIGGRQRETRRTFTNHDLAVGRGLRVYLTTDGLSDQPDSNGVKFGASRFKAFLREHGSLCFEDQGERLEQALRAHQQQEPQRDDIAVVGLDIEPA
ncbi:MAG: SpoIIE family protein phosphatase [Myxococcales bacterium]